MSLGLGLGLGLGFANSFTPKSIPGLVLWLRSDLGVTIVQGPVLATGTTPPAVTFAGTPASPSNSIVLTCTGAGTNTTATFSWTLNGVAQTPFTAAATVLLPGTGITATFPTGSYTNTPSADTYTSVVTSSAWADQSGGGNNFTQATASLRPRFTPGTYAGKPAITGARTSQLTNAGLTSPASAGTIVLTLSPSAVEAYACTGSNSNTSSIIQHFTGSSLEWFNAGGTDRATLSTSPSAGLHQVIISQTNGVSCVGYFDGVQAFSLTPTGIIGYVVNLFSESNDFGWPSDIVECIQYSIAVTPTQAAQLHAYSRSFWNTP